jgi:hypothetical protein
MDRVLVINAVFATWALVTGLYSRSLATALVAGIWIALVHTGLVMLSMAQAGTEAVTEVSALAGLLDTFMQSGYSGFAHARTVAYFAATVGILLLLTLAAFCFSWFVSKITLLILPQKASA